MYIITLSATFCIVAYSADKELVRWRMATDSGYKSTLRDDNSQYSPREQNSQEMRRYSGVLSVYGEQQVMQSPAAIAAFIAIHMYCNCP